MKIGAKIFKLYLLCWVVYIYCSQLIKKHNGAVLTKLFDRTSPTSINLVIAHPDDEVMFFAPTVLQMDTYFARDVEVRVICLTNGGADGLGATRVAELRHSMRMLLPSRKTSVFVSDFEDGMAVEWDIAKATAVLDEHIKDSKPLLLTFDEDGVSGHVNHISCFHAVELLKQIHPSVDTYALVSSKFVLLKYLGFLPGLYETARNTGRTLLISSFAQYIHAFAAMTNAHVSQMVWFRYGWWIASTFVFSNELQRF
ncbi:LAFE_0G07118g1_1 [Lachancea fermentati]|uniref:N-acetylglucosaminylphosphatidylinositol deacetylase n=1 Tax=Lachancea fermentati TaxID=4955 RepID=A0A1G4MHA4_LACFM|nr:LAFE_0G07118g1_1 [Lachancea fermentati]